MIEQRESSVDLLNGTSTRDAPEGFPRPSGIEVKGLNGTSIIPSLNTTQ